MSNKDISKIASPVKTRKEGWRKNRISLLHIDRDDVAGSNQFSISILNRGETYKKGSAMKKKENAQETTERLQADQKKQIDMVKAESIDNSNTYKPT